MDEHRLTYYLGPDNVPVWLPLDDLVDWLRANGGPQKSLAVDLIGNDKLSTVFLGVDARGFHLGEPRPPLCFETALFTARKVIILERYETHDEALHGHALFLAELQARQARRS